MILTMTMAIATSPALTSKAAVTSTKENSLGNSFLRTLGIGDPDIYYPRFSFSDTYYSIFLFFSKGMIINCHRR
jgi:hypothetical protein